MDLLSNRAIKQLIDSTDAAAIIDMMATKVAILYKNGWSNTSIVSAVTPVLRMYYTSSQITIFVQTHLHDDVEKYDGYGPTGFEENTGLYHMTVSCNKNEEEKIVRTISVSFSTVEGESQNFDVPKKVTVTEIS